MAKKRILIVNKFLYPRGGDCIVALSEAELLRRAGHEVELWGMDYPDNLPSLPLADTFAPRVDFAGPLPAKLRAMGRMMGLGDVKASFAEALRRFRPDTVHFHNIHSYLSPIIIGMAKQAGCRTLWTMHDYKLVCPAYNCLDSAGNICTDCISKPMQVIKKHCMKGSLLQSVAAKIEAFIWNRPSLINVTDTFICPSSFMASILHKAGIPNKKTAVVCNALDEVKTSILGSIDITNKRNNGRLLYVGRLSNEKGLILLLEEYISIQNPSLSLEIFGAGPMEASLRAEYGKHPSICFHGHRTASEISHAIVEANLLICPSQWYENNPLSIIESLSLGTPVIGSNIGGIPELITSSSGLLFDPFTPGSLADAIRRGMATTWNHQAISQEALCRFSAKAHLDLLERLL
ncbi:MAG: glycosyltransferase [Pseudoflavonifractor sp.]|nr:glycosyltransferase [Alloprevotella sp.]MCM1116118.1 glycosyltransferase [Pseudoflavonifractor sp.]